MRWWYPTQRLFHDIGRPWADGYRRVPDQDAPAAAATMSPEEHDDHSTTPSSTKARWTELFRVGTGTEDGSAQRNKWAGRDTYVKRVRARQRERSYLQTV